MCTEDVYMLGIETSCDETSAAVVKNGRYVLSNVISSQIDIHERYGGVVPEVASRKHIENISMVIDSAIINSGINITELDAISVTNGPGLVGALLVGVSYAKGLSYSIKKPLVSVNHIESHICSNYLQNDSIKPPFVCLIVSGGHTQLVYVKDYGIYEVLGKTRDDAVGEAYDKVARVIGLEYPGGPKIDMLASKGNPKSIKFPRITLEEGSLDFSFSGLKSSVLNYVNKLKIINEDVVKEDVAASFQEAAVEVLVQKAIKSCNLKNSNVLTLAGGVSCNTHLRTKMYEECIKRNIIFHVPESVYCTDNAAMVASCGFYNFTKGKYSNLDLNAYPSLSL